MSPLDPLKKLSNRFPNAILRFKWTFWLIVTNVVMAWIFGIKYLTFVFPIDLPNAKLFGEILVVFFIIITYFSYLALLTVLYFSVTLIPFVIFITNPLVLRIIAAISASFYLLFLLIDSLVFVMFRFHINLILLKMLFSREVLAIFNPSLLEISIFSGITLAIFILEYALIKLSWNWVLIKRESRLAKLIILYTSSAVVLSYVIYFTSIATDINAFSQQVKVLPYFTQIIATLSPYPDTLTKIEHYRESKYMQLKQVIDKLKYPNTPLTCYKSKTPLNVVLIVIDTWRLDALNQVHTPQIASYLNRAVQFKHHYSGGNSTQAGIFSLFYSIPNNYWTSTINQHIGPVLIDELQKQQYQLGIFASATLTLPEFDKNVFLNVSPLPLESDGDFPADKDRSITKKFLNFLKHRSPNKPFFAFLFYDAAHAYCTTQNYSQPFKPAIGHCIRLSQRTTVDKQKYINRYYNALHFVDQQVGVVLKRLQDAKLLDNTVVIITGDHGQEFDDNKRGYWEHASNYTPYQIQTPLMVIWPQKTPQTIHYLTTHYDIVPTLMQRVLKCKNHVQDYSIGQNLFIKTRPSFVITGSYINFGIVSKNRITTVYPSGSIEIQDLTAKPLNEEPNQELIIKALDILRRYYY